MNSKKLRGLTLLFFFSSRRRHTRSLRDWSSDVCSSDLGASRDSDGIAGELHAEAYDEVRHAVGPHLELVARAQVGQRVLGGGDGAAQRDELGEEPLEAGRRDDLEDPTRLVAGVPERVPLAARLVY